MLLDVILAIIVLAIVLPFVKFVGSLIMAPVLGILCVLLDFMKEHKILAAIIIILLLIIAF